jgi:hypothetical protein
MILDFYECAPLAFRLITYGVTSSRSTPRGALSSRHVALATCTAGNGSRGTYLPAPAAARRSPSSQVILPAESVARGNPVQAKPSNTL